MPCPFTGPKIFCAGPNFLNQPKNLTAFRASKKPFVPAKKQTILLNVNHFFVWHKMFVTGTICK
jgi:2-keto-4-pentenoate hydratase/2-oxohepta-3-ene-1,7-dioic acid hydratase in catechol pathway